MWDWIRLNMNEIGVAFTVLAFLLSVIVLAFSSPLGESTRIC